MYNDSSTLSMLTENFIASTGVPIRASGTTAALKDAGIFLHELQPLAAQRTVFKKSATPAHCLAVSENHIFAAQSEKAVVHVYNRSKGNQEATVPFPERITSISLACDDNVLILGTLEGRIFLWELCSGRQVTTNQAHLQAVTVLAVDANSIFVLSGSQDSTIHVWSIPDLLTFARIEDPSPFRTFSSHRAGITALILGHSASECNFAISASTNKTCHLWNYRTGHVLRTYLLPDVPTSLALDPADRAVYVGYEDGTIQQLLLYSTLGGKIDAVQNDVGSTELVKRSLPSRWKLPDASHGALSALGVSFDGSLLISGHASGSVLLWDTARGSFMSMQTQTPLPGPVTNLNFLPVQGLQKDLLRRMLKIAEIVKPKFGAFANSNNGTVPGEYHVRVQLSDNFCSLGDQNQPSMFANALSARSFPTAVLDEGICELLEFGKDKSKRPNENLGDDEDFVSLDDSAAHTTESVLKAENDNLRLQLQALRRVQKTSFDKIEILSKERTALLAREQKRLANQKRPELNGRSGSQSDDRNASMDDSD